MQQITNTVQLRQAIQLLEIKQTQEEQDLKVQFNQTIDSFNPIINIKNSLGNLVSSPDLISKLLNAAFGLTTGIVTKKILIGGSKNPILKILGTALEFGITGLIAKNPDKIKSLGASIIERIFGRKKTE